jgi:hypothetical protein
MDSTTTTPRAAKLPAAPPPPRLVAAAVVGSPEFELDSSAIDIIRGRTAEIRALASCAVCLTAVEATCGQFEGNELNEDDLPLLGRVIMRLAQDVDDAGDRLWKQFRQTAAVANGKELQS